MRDYALILNAGSSSLKFCVFERPGTDWGLASRGQIEGIGTSPRISAKDGDGVPMISEPLTGGIKDQHDAIDALAKWLRSVYTSARVLGVGHRVVHGGARFAGPTVLTPEIVEQLRQLTTLAPLHQPYNLAAIDVVFERMPDVPQVACFDTSFHRTQSPIAELVPLPAEFCREGLQRYGFHGLSYEYIAGVLREISPEIANARVIVAHLGSGASLCAMKAGKSVDSSLGFTALDGLCMGTRPGAVDPGVILYLFQERGLTAKDVETILYKKSGLLGISGISNDMRDLLGSTDPRAQLAVDYFIHRAAKEIGAMAAALGGVDALVFTAGIGENSAEIRERICKASAWLGLKLDHSANHRNSTRISTVRSHVSAWVVPTNEELMIARHTGRLLGLVPAKAQPA